MSTLDYISKLFFVSWRDFFCSNLEKDRGVFFVALSNTLLRWSATSKFLLILALGTFCLMLLSFIFVRPVLLPEQGNSQLEDGDVVREPTFQQYNHSLTPLFNNDSIQYRYVRTDNGPGEKSNSFGEV